MKMSFKSLNLLKKGNIVNIENNFGMTMNYLITNVSKKDKFTDVMPILMDDDDIDIPIKLSMPFEMIKTIKKVNVIDLIYMVGKKNPDINNAIKKYIK